MITVLNNQYEKNKRDLGFLDTNLNATIATLDSTLSLQINTAEQNITNLSTSLGNRVTATETDITTLLGTQSTLLSAEAGIRTDFAAADTVLNTRITNEITTINNDYLTLTNEVALVRTDFLAADTVINNTIIANKTESNAKDTQLAADITLVRTDFEAADITINSRLTAIETFDSNLVIKRLDKILEQTDFTAINYDVNGNITDKIYAPITYNSLANQIYKEVYTYDISLALLKIDYVNTTNANTIEQTNTFTYDLNGKLYSSTWTII